jgi:predicted acetyltransferase
LSKQIIQSKLISLASLSAIEPVSFNACLFFSKSIKANTFLYQYSNRPSENELILMVEPVLKEDISGVKTFLKEQIGFDDTFGYTENLVERKEIYLLKESGVIIATSECRLSDSQAEVADLGIIVNKDYQGKGIATQVLKQQILRAREKNRKPICSTTVDNLASQKAIEKAGFYRSNIIFDMSFLRR